MSPDPPAADDVLNQTAERLGVSIPISWIAQFKIQNGGYPFVSYEDDFCEGCLHDAAVDGLWPLESWYLASEDDVWFEESPVKDPHLLIVVSDHAESKMCLDYRDCGPTGVPKLTHIVLGVEIEENVECDDANAFVDRVISIKQVTGT